jgi:hypothetical protein
VNSQTSLHLQQQVRVLPELLAFAQLCRDDIFGNFQSDVIPGRGRSVAKVESPESITTDQGYGFRARRSASLLGAPE